MVLTVHEREIFNKNGRLGISDIVRLGVEEGRIISFDKKKRADLSVMAKQGLVT